MTRPLPPNAVSPPPIRQPILPPEGLPGEPVEAAPAPAPTPRPAREKMAVLRFLDPGAVSKIVPLKYPFAYVGEGGEEIVVREITVRRLAVAEVGSVLDVISASDKVDLYEFYAAMTGHPAAVLRAIPDDEGVIEACGPFLPAAAQELISALTLVFGAATPSPPPAPVANLLDES